MRTQIDLKRLRYIVEIARCESIPPAAETLSLPQPALTRSVAEVENELGTKLFHRLPRGVSLTEQGERFVQGARRVIGDVDDLISDIRDASDALSGRLRIGVSPLGYAEMILPELATIAREHPEVRIETVGGTAQSLCPQLLRGEINFLIAPSSYLARWKELQVIEFREMHFACVIRKDHPLTTKREVKEVDLLEYPVVLPSSVELMYSDTVQRYAHHNLYPPQPRYVSDSLEVIKTLVSSSDAYFPLHSADPKFAHISDDFHVLSNVLQLPSHNLSLATASQQPASAEAKLFEDLLVDRYTDQIATLN